MIDDTLAVLSDSTRREVVDLLRARPRRPSELAAELRTTRPALGRHLRVLRESGLIEEEHGHVRDARARVYRLRPDKLDELWNWLTFIRSFWGDPLELYKQHPVGVRGRRRPGTQ